METISKSVEDILISEKLVTSQQLEEARSHGNEGKESIGRRLFRLGYINEAQLVAAVSRLYGCKAVIISDIKISADILRLIPAQFAWERKALPLQHDLGRNLLKVACEDPWDGNLLQELSTIVPGIEIELCVAAGPALDCAIIRHYRQAIVRMNSEGSEYESPLGFDAEDHLTARRILVIAEDLQDARSYWGALAHESLVIVAVDTTEEAIREIGAGDFAGLFIQNTDLRAYTAVVNRFKDVNPGSPVRLYDSVTDIITADAAAVGCVDLLVKNMQLFSSLLVPDKRLQWVHADKVGRYVNQVCCQLDLPDNQRLIITTAAYLHDFARIFVTTPDEVISSQNIANLAATSLHSRGYPASVAAVLRAMYQVVEDWPTRPSSMEFIGGNILLTVDYFVEHWPDTEKMSVEQLESLKDNLRELSGKLFLPEVVDGLLSVLRQEIVTTHDHGSACQVMLFVEGGEDRLMLALCLTNIGFGVTTVASVDECVTSYQHGKPHILLMQTSGDIDDASDLVANLIAQGLPIAHVSTFLLAPRPVCEESTSFLRQGIEDVMSTDDDLDPLLFKMIKIRGRLKAASVQILQVIQDMGTHGSLEDMNVIDLLQAMASSGKTARISISALGNQLTVFLNQGRIIFAECDEKKGADAVYMGLPWIKGIWSVDPVDSDELPRPNIFRSLDSLLIEGCTLLDEQNRVSGSHEQPFPQNG